MFSNKFSEISSKDIIPLDLNRILKYLIVFFVFIIITGFSVVFVSQLKSNNHYINSFMNIYVRLFDMDKEANIPAWFSSFILLFSACLLLFISYYKDKNDSNQRYWKILAFIFLYLSIDELASIHEDFNNPVRSLLHLGGIFYWSWIVPAILILVILFFYFFRFLLSLPKDTRNLFLLSAIIFISGAIVLEMIGGLLYSKQMNNSFASRIEIFFEEVLEITGVLIFIYSLLKYIKKEGVSILVKRANR